MKQSKREKTVLNLDLLKLFAANFIENGRRALAKAIDGVDYNELSKEMKIKIAAHNRSVEQVPFDEFRKQVLSNDGVISALADTVMGHNSQPKDEDLARVPLMYGLADIMNGSCGPFYIENPDTVDNIAEAKIGLIKPGWIKLPFNEIIIGLSKPVMVAGNRFDMVYVSNHAVMSSKEEAQKSLAENKSLYWGDNIIQHDAIVIIYINSTNIMGCLSMYANINSENFFNEEVKESELALKLIQFITSTNVRHVKVDQWVDMKHKHDTYNVWHRNHFRVVNVVKTETVEHKTYNCNTGRTLSVATWVVGHFKHHTVGRLTGRYIWCPPHRRGPDIGQQVADREYHMVK